MRVQIQIKGLPDSANLRRFAAHKLDLALSRFSHMIDEASMRLSDINGPERGGADKLCRVMLTMNNHSITVVEDLGSDMPRVIDRAVDRLHQDVSRQMSGQVKIDRSSSRQNLLSGG